MCGLSRSKTIPICVVSSDTAFSVRTFPDALDAASLSNLPQAPKLPFLSIRQSPLNPGDIQARTAVSDQGPVVQIIN